MKNGRQLDAQGLGLRTQEIGRVQKNQFWKSRARVMRSHETQFPHQGVRVNEVDVSSLATHDYESAFKQQFKLKWLAHDKNNNANNNVLNLFFVIMIVNII